MMRYSVGGENGEKQRHLLGSVGEDEAREKCSAEERPQAEKEAQERRRTTQAGSERAKEQPQQPAVRALVDRLIIKLERCSVIVEKRYGVTTWEDEAGNVWKRFRGKVAAPVVRGDGSLARKRIITLYIYVRVVDDIDEVPIVLVGSHTPETARWFEVREDVWHENRWITTCETKKRPPLNFNVGRRSSFDEEVAENMSL